MSKPSRIETILHLPPRWASLVALAVAVAVAAWRSVTNSAAHQPRYFLSSLAWPGVAIFLAVYAFAWLGWALEID